MSNDMMSKETVCLGVLAHVDAGKTTLSETLLFEAGQIRRRGRVDHQDSFLDTDRTERARGITIFSKEARFDTADRHFILLDTPGHVDFSAEAERTLQVLDYAILVVSGSEGVQNHTVTLWHLLEKYRMPTFVFVNKTDLAGFSREKVLKELREKLGSGFAPYQALGNEDMAMADEEAMNSFLESGSIDLACQARLVKQRKLYPVFFGSALQMDGVAAFLEALNVLTVPKEAAKAFGARVYKISHDEKGQRLTHLRLTGGELSVRDAVSTGEKEEKVAQIRLYNGEKFTNADCVTAGDVCAVLGWNDTYAGQGLGTETGETRPVLLPVMSYHMALPPQADAVRLLPKIKMLEEEDPSLAVRFEEATQQIFVSLMGEVQTETLQGQIQERFGVSVSFDQGEVLYKETIQTATRGIGHYEPLRHYAEVHLLLEPGPRGSGISFETKCMEEDLSFTFQRLVMTHVFEKEHRGTLIGAPLTDVKITLLTGRAHEKHTEGGDFREATYRAIRQGLMKTQVILLEPVYVFEMEVPSETVGSLMTDFRQMSGTCQIEHATETMTLLSGKVPVAEMNGYWKTLNSVTRGRGSRSFRLDGYEPCHDTEAVRERIVYDPEKDLANSPDSVFCVHGAGVEVPWREVDARADLQDGKQRTESVMTGERFRQITREDERVEALMDREFGPIRRREYTQPVVYGTKVPREKEIRFRARYFLIDGYNLIHSAPELNRLALEDLGHARERLETMLINYLHYTNSHLILVYDGYKVKGNPGEREERSGLAIAYSKEGETADALIERLISEMGKNYEAAVVTSDALIQVSAVTTGVLRLPSAEFYADLKRVSEEISEKLQKTSE